MARGLNKEWEHFGARYRVAGAKVEKVNCKACNKPVSAAVNRLQSHMRVCPARTSLASALHSSNSSVNVNVNVNAPQPPADSLSAAIEQAIETDAQGTEQAAPVAADGAAPPLKKQRQSPARTRDRPRWNAAAPNAAASLTVDDFWFSPVVGGAAAAASPSQQSVASSFNKRRLEIEEKRLALEIQREQREQTRERLNLEILAAQAKRERLLAEKEGYEAKVLLALSRKQLRDQGVNDEEIDRVLPVDSSSATTEATAVSSTTADSPDSELH